MNCQFAPIIYDQNGGAQEESVRLRTVVKETSVLRDIFSLLITGEFFVQLLTFFVRKDIIDQRAVVYGYRNTRI